jgi:hypothetical protein
LKLTVTLRRLQLNRDVNPGHEWTQVMGNQASLKPDGALVFLKSKSLSFKGAIAPRAGYIGRVSTSATS